MTPDALAEQLNAEATAFSERGRYREAIKVLRRALRLAPAGAGLWFNLAQACLSGDRWADAAEAFENCIKYARLYNDAVTARLSWSFAQLNRGDWVRGFENFEARLDLASPPTPRLPGRPWRGEPLDGKTIYVHPEQGLGDRLMFSRFYAAMMARWPTARILTADSSTFGELLPAFPVTILKAGAAWPNLDYHAFLGSLPLLLGITLETLPADDGGLRALAERSPPELTYESTRGPKVGVAWTGSEANARNDERSIPAADLLWALNAFTLFSFQVGASADPLPPTMDVVDLGTFLASRGLLAGAQALIQMDVVVTVCTATAHFAGALGVPTLLMLDTDCHWAWLRDREDSIWYPSVRIFRQRRAGEWGPVLADVRDALGQITDLAA